MYPHKQSKWGAELLRRTGFRRAFSMKSAGSCFLPSEHLFILLSDTVLFCGLTECCRAAPCNGIESEISRIPLETSTDTHIIYMILDIIRIYFGMIAAPQSLKSSAALLSRSALKFSGLGEIQRWKAESMCAKEIHNRNVRLSDNLAGKRCHPKKMVLNEQHAQSWIGFSQQSKACRVSRRSVMNDKPSFDFRKGGRKRSHGRRHCNETSSCQPSPRPHTFKFSADIRYDELRLWGNLRKGLLKSLSQLKVGDAQVLPRQAFPV